MPTANVVWIGTSIESAIVYTMGQIAAFADLYIEGASGSYVAPTVGAYRGCLAIQFSLQSEEFGIANFNAVAPDSLPGDRAPIRNALSYPGFSSSNVFLTGHFGDTAEYLAFWEDVFLAAKVALIENATTGVVAGVTTNSADFLSARIKCTESSILIQGPSRYFTTQDVARFCINIDPPWTDEIPRYTPEVQEQATVVGSNIDLTSLTSAVNAITDQDYEISINQGAYVFSLKAKVGAS